MSEAKMYLQFPEITKIVYTCISTFSDSLLSTVEAMPTLIIQNGFVFTITKHF